MHRHSLNDPLQKCPCGSPRPGHECCLDSEGNVRGVPTAIPPAPRSSGLSNARCYAAPIGGCSSEISREHYLSAALLRRLTEDGGRLNLSKFVWLEDGETKQLAPDNVAAKVLCKTHNEALSAYDAVGDRFCGLLLRCGWIADGGPPAVGLFNGEDLERWFLKTLCGITAMEAEVHGRSWRAPVPWLESLFGIREAMPPQMGLWINLGGVVMFPDNAPNLSATPIDNPNGTDPLGLRFGFSGLELVFLCTTSVRSKYAPNGRLRPGLLTIESPHYCTVRIGIRYRYSPSGVHLRMSGVNPSVAGAKLHP